MKSAAVDRGEPDPKLPGIVVLRVRRHTQCQECKRELVPGKLLRVENGKPFCLDCADLGHLEYVPRGNPALIRRAIQHSQLRAVVVQWSRARKRHERQGILALPEAIRRAEEQSLRTAEARERRRRRTAARREEEDRVYVAAVAEAIQEQFPGAPAREARAIADYTCRKNLNRAGHSGAAKELDLRTLRLAVIAHVRHEHTPYDRLLGQSVDRQLARSIVWPQVEEVLARWSRF